MRSIAALEPLGRFLQWRLTFGILEELVCFEIPEWFLLKRAPDGTVTIVGDNLPALLRDWCSRVRLCQDVDQGWLKEWTARTDAVLDAVHMWSLHEKAFKPHMLRAFLSTGIEEGMAHDILSTLAEIATVVVLARTWANVVTSEDPRLPLWDPPPHQYREWMSLGTIFVDVRVPKREWCPFVLGLVTTLGSHVLGYASTQLPFSRGGPEAHAECTERECKVNNIDTTTYRNKHVSDECQCEYVRPSLEDVEASLSSGRIPVLVPHGAGSTLR